MKRNDGPTSALVAVVALRILPKTHWSSLDEGEKRELQKRCVEALGSIAGIMSALEEGADDA